MILMGRSRARLSQSHGNENGRRNLAYNCRVHDFDNESLATGRRRRINAGLPGNYLRMVRFSRTARTTLRVVKNGIHRSLSLVDSVLHARNDCGRVLAGQEGAAIGGERGRAVTGRRVSAGGFRWRHADGVECGLRRGGRIGRWLRVCDADCDLREVVSG